MFNKDNGVGLQATPTRVTTSNGNQSFAVSITRPHNGNCANPVITRSSPHEGGESKKLCLIDLKQDKPYATALGKRFFDNNFLYTSCPDNATVQVVPEDAPHHRGEITIGLLVRRPKGKPLIRDIINGNRRT